MAINVNAVDCNKNQLGTGVIDCIIKEGKPVGFIAVKKGWSILLTGTLDLVELVQEKIAVPFLQSVEFLDNTPEDVIEEFQGGFKAVVRNGKPEFSFKFVKGYPFHSSSFSNNSLNAFDFLLVFDSGAIMGAKSADGLSLKGLSGGMLNTSSYKFTDGAVNANSLVAFQLTNPDEFNSRGAFLTSAELGIDVNDELYGIIDVVPTVTAAAGENILVAVKALANSAFNIEGLTSANFKLEVDGLPATIDIVSYSNGIYTLEPAVAITAGDTVKVKVADTGFEVAKVGNKLYQGESAVVTATA